LEVFVVSIAPGKKLGTIAIMLDERLSRERGTLLARVINSIRTFATVEMLSAATTEDQVLSKMERGQYDLILLPWYRYLAWTRVDAFWGLTRTSGPTVAGYFCEQVLPYEIGEQAQNLRAILLDFANLQNAEIQVILKSLQKDTSRAGIRPLLDSDAKIYVENWYGAQGLGTRIDSVLSLPEFSEPKWIKRKNSLRISLNALWSLVYEEGPGKGELVPTGAGVPKAYFQVACDREVALLRLCYSMQGWSPKDAISTFWPNAKAPTAPAQLLLKYADFLRVHTFANGCDVEIVAGFFPSACSELAHGQIHSLWIEPMADNLLTERTFEVPGPASPRLRPLPSGALSKETQIRGVGDAKVIELQSILKKKEELIQELKSGGVGTSAPLPPPDAEQLLEAFQEKYFDARFQIRQLELEIVEMEKKGASSQDLTNIRLKMEALANRERSWIKTLAGTLETYRTARKK
jgi:hypothetical protein